MNLTTLLTALSPPLPLFKTACPTEIHATIPHVDSVFIERRSKSIHQIHSLLEKCPDITTLDLRSAFIGCIALPERWSLPIDPAGGTKYRPAVRSLSLDGYKFDSDLEHVKLKGWEDAFDWIRSGNAWKSLRWSLIPEVQRSKTNLELWTEAMDFSQLRELSIRRYSPLYMPDDLLAQVLSPRLPSLRSLKLEGPELRDFLLALPAGSLTSLSWIDPEQPRDQIRRTLEHHGASLTELEWRHAETLSRPASPAATAHSRRPQVTRAESAIVEHRPRPRRRKLAPGENEGRGRGHAGYAQEPHDLLRDGEASPADRGTRSSGTLDATPSRTSRSPLLNSTSARDAASFLRGHGAGSLEEVNFFAGDWTRDHGEPLQMTDWLRQRRAWMKCKMPAGEGEVIC